MVGQIDWVELIRWIIGLLLGSGVIVFIISRIAARSDRMREYDKDTMERIKADLSGVIAYVRLHDFGGSFSNSIFEQFDLFVVHSEEPEYKFAGKKLEKKRTELVSEMGKFAEHLAMNSYPLNNPNVSKIFPDEHEDMERYKELRDELNKMNKIMCTLYNKLVDTAKREI